MTEKTGMKPTTKISKKAKDELPDSALDKVAGGGGGLNSQATETVTYSRGSEIKDT
ncbi:hypothetical protein [Devosia sp. Leaf64]|uniref:hypothetical protein n=1 Tax=Devosia sp. Leaf64 TaxID=1736229 RepID=UPI0012E2D112|nr:hypothetical protein [Devosia sp. Leaf64]